MECYSSGSKPVVNNFVFYLFCLVVYGSVFDTSMSLLEGGTWQSPHFVFIFFHRLWWIYVYDRHIREEMKGFKAINLLIRNMTAKNQELTTINVLMVHTSYFLSIISILLLNSDHFKYMFKSRRYNGETAMTCRVWTLFINVELAYGNENVSLLKTISITACNHNLVDG